MAVGALDKRHSGSQLGERRGGKDQSLAHGLPPWRGWKTRSRAARAIRFIEAYCRVPSGHNAGQLIKLAKFQRESLEVLLADGVRTGGEQIPRGNAKSTLWAAVGLWALCDYPDSPQVPLVAYNSLQAQRTLFNPIKSMIRAHPELDDRLAVYSASGDRRVWSAWNDGTLLPLPADPDRLQGLNPTVALIDEAQTLDPPVLSAVLQGAGKRSESLVLAIGTPEAGRQGSALHLLREQAGGPAMAWVEYAAPAGCALDDRKAWAIANPALAAGLLQPDVLESELRLVTEAEFRCYRLGQWIDAVVAGWLPTGAWNTCPRVDVPPDGTEIVLALAGTWNTHSVALVGATCDGALFVAWADDAATDAQLAQVIDAASARWTVLEVVVAPRTRPNLVADLLDEGVPVEVWPNKTDIEVESATEWRRAIIEGRVAHDHHPLLAAHVAATVARSTPDGSLKLGPPDDERPVDAARAARMAWWRSLDVGARHEEPAIY